MGHNRTAARAFSSLRVRFQMSLLALIIGILLVASGASLVAVLSISRTVGTDHARQLFGEAGFRVEERLNAQLNRALGLADQISSLPGLTAKPERYGLDYPALAFMIETLSIYSDLYSLYTGFPDGSFLQVIRSTGNRAILTAHAAPSATSYIVRAIALVDGQRRESWSFLDSELQLLTQRSVSDPRYDPRTRPWFIEAETEKEQAVLTEPYLYDSLQQPGITAARSAREGVVVGVDITLEGLRYFLQDLDVSPGTGLLLLDTEQFVLAATTTIQHLLDQRVEPMSSAEALAPRVGGLLASALEPAHGEERLEINENFGYLIWSREWSVLDGRRFRLVTAAPLDDFVGPFQLMQSRVVTITVVLMLLVLPLVHLASRSLSRFLEALAADATKIRHFDFAGATPEHRFILEFEQLSVAFTLMKRTVEARTRALAAERDKLERIIELGIAMSVEQNTDRLLELILKGAKEISHADGGSLYLKEGDEFLEFKIVLNDSLHFAQGGANAAPITMPPVPLYMESGTPNLHNVVTCAYHTGRTIAIEDAYHDPDFDFSGTQRFDKLNGYRSESFLTVPLKVHGGEILGALQLINSISPTTGKVVPFDNDIQGFVEALSAESAAVLYNRNLVEEHLRLFDSLIRLIAGAIDTKSPYTGGHCKRVPELAEMLADEIESVTEGPFAGFVFESEDDRRAFQIGAWLHDCGKMTTPDYVMDKAVKLETLYNRIHEIRMRFEVLLRDSRIRELEAVASGVDTAQAAAESEADERQLIEDFAFVAECNHGAERLDQAKIARLRAIGARTWYRRLNPALGLSWEEHRRFTGCGAASEPGPEPLLGDKPEHRIPHPADHSRVYEDFGFTLMPSQWAYNRGELYNLSIGSGTLTPEERFKVNEHILQTIVMLERLPFPDSLSRAPRYAATHHENLDGTGYPMRIRADQLSVPERIMAIADKFEALTASDRPYKPAKTLSEAVAVLFEFKQRGEIDPEMFDLFLRNGVYRRYAERYLRPDQIDECNLEAYLGPV